MLMPIGASWGRCEEPYRGYFRPLESHRATLSRWGTLGVAIRDFSGPLENQGKHRPSRFLGGGGGQLKN